MATGNASAQPEKEKAAATPQPLNIDTLEFRLEHSGTWPVRTRVLGQVKKLLAEEGSLIQAGTPLVQLDDERAQLEYNAAEARFRRAFLRYRQLAASDDETATGIAEAQKKAAGQLLRVAKTHLDNHVIKAPVTGYLTEIQAPVGSIAKIGDTVVTLTIEEKLHLQVPLSRGKVSLGSTVAIKIGTQLFDTKVIKLDPPIEEHTRLQAIVNDIATATLEVPNTKHQLRRGDTALVPQHPFVLIPRQAISVSPEGQTSIYVTRKDAPVALPVDVSSAIDGGLFVSAAPLEADDVILSAPAPGAQVSPDPLAGTVVFPLADSALDVSALKEQLPDFTKSLQQYVEAATEQAPNAPIPNIDIQFPTELQGILQNADYPLSEMKLDDLYKTLNLTPDEIIAFEELKAEFNQRVEEQGLKIDSLDDLKDIDGVEEYLQFVQGIRALNHDFANQLISELDEDQVQQLQQSFDDYFGLSNLSDSEKVSSLNLSDEQKAQIDKTMKEIDGERFKVLQDLAKKAITSQNARDRIFKLIDEKSKNDFSFLPENFLASMLNTEFKAANTQSDGKSNGNSTKVSTSGKTNKPKETPEDRTKREAKEKEDARKRMLANLRKPAAPADSASSGEGIDYGFYALIGTAVVIALGALAFFSGVFSGGSGGPKKAKKKKFKRTRRIVVGDDEEITTIADALADARENREFKEGIPWDRQIILLAPGSYNERIVLGGDDPAGLAIHGHDGVAELSSPDGKPIIELNGVSDFELANAKIDANGQANPVLARDCTGHMTFENVTISDYSQVGLRVSGRMTDASIQFDLIGCEINTTSDQAMGANVDLSTYEHSSLNMKDCRLIGPMHMALVLKSPVQQLDVRTTIFANCEVGVLISGTSHPYESATFTNNTFYNLSKGVSFKHIDEVSKKDKPLAFYSNIFAEIQVAEISVSGQESIDNCEEIQTALNEMVAKNLCNRAEPADHSLGQLSPFGTADHDVTDFDFASTEPGDAQFLGPGPESPQRNSWTKFGSEPYVGAVGPLNQKRKAVQNIKEYADHID